MASASTDRFPLSRVDGKAYYRGQELPPGPWHEEPDHVDFVSPDGFACILHRNNMGAWCGYVAVPPSHPWHGKDYGDLDAEVHGGLTYADRCQGDICHVPQPGESDDVWWLGFDCIHSGDMSLYDVNERGSSPFGETYKTMDYARAETRSLAVQAHVAGMVRQ